MIPWMLCRADDEKGHAALRSAFIHGIAWSYPEPCTLNPEPCNPNPKP